MSVWKPINESDVNTHTVVVHKEFNLDSSSYGVDFIQFKSGSSTDFPTNQSGSYWDANRVNFYLSGSQYQIHQVFIKMVIMVHQVIHLELTIQ